MKLIAGIDPGTTVGWAVLDLRGKLIAVGSQKELDLDSLIAKLTSFGKVIVVGSDKAKIPFFVHNSAAKLGARIAGPLQDFRVDEKRKLASEFHFQNSHEMDAIASAFIAFKKIQPLLNKVYSFLEHEKRLGLFEDAAEIVLKEGISIRAAVAVLTPKEEKVELPKEVQEKDEELVELFQLLSRTRKDTETLLKKNRKLENELFTVKQELHNLKEKAGVLVKPKTPVEIARIKDSQINSLSHRLKNSLQMQSKLSQLVEKLEKNLLAQDKIPLLRLARLGFDEVVKNKEFISEGSILFVDDANEISEKAVVWLHEKGIQIIICGRLPGTRARSQLPFACILAQDCELLNKLVLVKKDWLDKIRAERAVLAKIVEEYKKERLPS